MTGDGGMDILAGGDDQGMGDRPCFSLFCYRGCCIDLIFGAPSLHYRVPLCIL